MRRLDSATPKELNKVMRQLRTELNGMQRGTAAWDAQVVKIRRVKSEVDKVNASLRVQEAQSSRIADSFKSIGLMALGAGASISGLMSIARQSVESYKARDTEEANTRKFTGLDVAGVAELNKELARIDTRTPREQLLMLAQEAGRLGKTSIKDLAGFVRGADKVNVALEDLGGEAVITLAKLNGIFGIEQQYGTEDALLKTGSVINVLSQNCAASKPYLAEFASRLGGIGAQSGMTMQQIMAFAAVLDTQNLAVEAAGTAMGQLVMKIYKDPQKIARAAGLDIQKFAATVKTDMNGALIMLFEHLKGVGGMEKLATVFGDMKTDGARAVPVLSALAGHIDELKQQQEVANKAFAEGVSVGNEFAIQNDTAAAKVDKAKNRINELRVELGEKLFPVMGALNRPTVVILEVLNRLTSFVIAHKKEITALVVTLATYNAVVAVSIARTKAAAIAHATLAATSRGVTALGAAFSTAGKLGRVGMIAITRGAGSATAAMRLLNVSLTAIPWLKIVATVASVAAALITLRSHTDEVTKAQKRAAEAAGALHAELDTERRDIDTLFNRLKLAERGTREYENAKSAIISQFGGYLQGLGREIETLQDVDAAYRAVTASANESARARGLAEANKNADDTRNKTWSDTAAELNEGLKALRIGDNGRRLTEREVGEWTQRLSDEIMGGGLSSDSERFLRSAGMYRDRSSKRKWRASSRGNTQGSSALGDVLNKREEAQAAWSLSRRLNDQNFNTADMKFRSLDTAGLNDALGKLQNMKSTGKFSQVVLANGQTLLVENSVDADAYINKIYDFQADSISGFRAPAAADRGIVDGEPTITPGTNGSEKGNKFKAEDEWRDMEQAKARIAKETGTIVDAEGKKQLYTISDYTARMENIELEYLERKLRRTDLSEKEKLELTAEYEGLRNKQLGDANALVLEDEQMLYALEKAQLAQSFIEGRISLSAYHHELEEMEARHLKNMVDLSEEGSEENARAREAYQSYQVKLAEKRQKELEASMAKREAFEKKYFGKPSEEDDANYASGIATLTSIYNDEVAKAAGNKKKLLQLEQTFQAAKLALAEQYNQAAADNEVDQHSGAMQKIGEWLESDGGRALAGSLNFIANNVGALFSQLSESIQADLEIQIAAIDRRYDHEIQYAEGNNAKIKRLELAREKEVAKAKADANRKMFSMQVVQAIAQTATAALNAYSSTLAIPIVGPALAPAAAALAVATGMIQVANIKKQQQVAESQGYMEGGFTKKGNRNDVAGVVHAGEWVAPQSLVNSPVARPFIDALEYARRTNKIGSLGSADVSMAAISPAISSRISADRIAEGRNSTFVVAQNAEYVDVMRRLAARLDEPFVTVNTVAGEYGIKAAEDEYNRLMANKTPRNRQKR